MTDAALSKLVTRGHALKGEITTRTDELKKIEEQLIEHGAGTLLGAGAAQCTVIVPNPGIKPDAAAIEACQGLAGASFKKLFEKVTTYKPVASFAAVASAVLTPAKAAKVIELCQKASSPFVKWAK